MESPSRRQFLGSALAAGVGATVVGPVAAPLAPAGAAADDPQTAIDADRDAGFVAGKVVDVAADGALAVVDLDGDVRHLRITPESQSWKAGLVNQQAIAGDDCVFARGTIASDGVLEVGRLWANINSFRARLRQLGRSALAVELEDGSSRDLAVRSVTDVIAADGGAARGDASGLKRGEDVQVISSGSADSGELLATRLISLAAPPSVVARDSRRRRHPRAHAAFTAAHSGNTTWFCCGNVSGCGAGCGSSGCGSCCSSYPCRSDLNAIAWPQLTNGCGPYCSGCCLASDFPSHSCGVCMDVRNPCINIVVRVRIRDCGPTVHCVGSTGCAGFSQVKFDLTPCAFTAVGGNLASGVQNLETAATIGIC